MQKILVVEDEESIREVLVLNLRMAGYEVAEAGSAESALSLFESGAVFDAAILDIMLPGMNGFSLCETIRREHADIGIIMLSAKAMEADKITPFHWCRRLYDKAVQRQRAFGARRGAGAPCCACEQ